MSEKGRTSVGGAVLQFIFYYVPWPDMFEGPNARRCRCQSQRSPLVPEGDVSRKFVQEGNLLAARCSLLVWLASCAGAIWIIEQPVQSLIMKTPRMDQMLSQVWAA